MLRGAHRDWSSKQKRVSIAILGKQKNLVTASPQTWGRYAKLLGWERPRQKQSKKSRPYQGLKATRPHDIWQIDNTEVRLADNKKLYLQVILDNYSRYGIAWQLNTNINKELSKNLTESALLKFGKNQSSSIYLVSDGGPENTGLTNPKNHNNVRIVHRIAKKEIKQSNTMIDSFFKTLKHSYLNHQVAHTL